MAVPSSWPRDIADAGGAYWPLTLFNAVPFREAFTLEGVDYTGASFTGEIRAAFEQTSTVLKEFGFVPTLVGGDTVVEFGLSASDVAALRSAADPGALNTLFYIIRIEPVGEDEAGFFAGELKLMGA